MRVTRSLMNDRMESSQYWSSASVRLPCTGPSLSLRSSSQSTSDHAVAGCSMSNAWLRMLTCRLGTSMSLWKENMAEERPMMMEPSVQCMTSTLSMISSSSTDVTWAPFRISALSLAASTRSLVGQKMDVAHPSTGAVRTCLKAFLPSRFTWTTSTSDVLRMPALRKWRLPLPIVSLTCCSSRLTEALGFISGYLCTPLIAAGWEQCTIERSFLSVFSSSLKPSSTQNLGDWRVGMMATLHPRALAGEWTRMMLSPISSSTVLMPCSSMPSSA